MKLPQLHELTILGVRDAGIPNRERVILCPEEEGVKLAEYMVCLGRMNEDGSVEPFPDNCFYFGGRVVSPPSLVILYTGPGRDLESRLRHSGQKTYIYHWDRRSTIFDLESIVPVLFRINGITIGSKQRLLGGGTAPRKSLGSGTA